MLERSPTLGSIETSDAVKRRMAVQTHEFNLKDKLFCDLFPGMAEKSRNFLSAAKTVGKNRQKESSQTGGDQDDPYEASLRQLENNEMMGGQGFYGAVTNFLVIGGFAAFAFVVQYVIQSLNQWLKIFLILFWKNVNCEYLPKLKDIYPK